MNTKYLEIIKAPVVTEKSTNGKNLNQYTFKVSPNGSLSNADGKANTVINTIKSIIGV